MAETSNILAAIDIGSSAIRMDVAEVRPDGQLVILESLQKGVQLGKDTFTHGSLNEETMRAACDVLRAYKAVLNSYGVVRYRAVATSAVREAENRDMFLDRILVSTGLDVEVIDGSEENRLTLLAVLESFRGGPGLSDGKTLAVEVGGGSTDVTMLGGNELLQSGTFPIGSIRLRAMVNAKLGPHEQQVRALKRRIGNLIGNIKRSIAIKDATNFVALGGDVRFVARILNVPRAGQSWVAGKEAFSELVDSITKLSIDDVVQKYSISYLDAETMGPALWTYLQMFKETHAKEIVISEANIRAGILQDLAPIEQGERLERLRHQILSAAHSLGRKYQYDEVHAEKVRELSEILFDELKAEHHLTDVHRLYLQVAALLHDIGLFVSQQGHHKHSQYLISASDLFGLRQSELQIIANIARYHRKGLPQRTHASFVSLEREERMMVSKLAAILRIANSLAKEPFQPGEFVVKREGDLLVITTEHGSDMALDRMAIMSRSDLLTEVYGNKVMLREADKKP